MHRRVMVAIDPKTTPGLAVEEAAVLARAHEAELVIAVPYSTRKTTTERQLYDETPYEWQWRLSPGSVAEDVAQAAVERAREFAGESVEIRTHCEPGKFAGVLTKLVDDLHVDLLVLDVHPGHGAFAITPRVAKAIARKAHCEVAAVGIGAPLPVPERAEPITSLGSLRTS